MPHLARTATSKAALPNMDEIAALDAERAEVLGTIKAPL